MRKLVVLLAVLVVLAASLGLAWLASDGAYWCRILGWCDRRSLM